MKKLLATLLLSLGVTTVAHAQSQVTVYGILDVGVSTRNLHGIPETATNTLTNTQIGSSYQIPSRLGFRGREDLGEGNYALFVIETGLTPTSSTLSSFNNRQSFVGLGKKDLGNITLGTHFGPIFKAMASTDPGERNSVMGSVIYPSAGTDGGQTSADAAFTLRFNNSIVATMDRRAGFSANALYAINNQDATKTGATTGGTTNANAYALGADYTKGNFVATLAYQSLKNITDSSATASVSSSFVGTNTTDNQLYAGVAYQLSKVKLYASYIDRKITSNLISGQWMDRSGQQIGVRGYVSQKVEGWASIGNGSYRAFGANQPTANFAAFQVGGNYWLSKRSNLYAIAGSTQTNSTGSTSSLMGHQVAVGMRHTF